MNKARYCRNNAGILIKLIAISITISFLIDVNFLLLCSLVLMSTALFHERRLSILCPEVGYDAGKFAIYFELKKSISYFFIRGLTLLNIYMLHRLYLYVS